MKKEEKKRTVKKRQTATGVLVKKKSLFMLPFMKTSTCSFLDHYNTPVLQQGYNCMECEITICEACADHCHDGHTVTKGVEEKFVCGCGSKGSCFCKAYEKFERLDKTDFNNTLFDEVMLKWNRTLAKCSVGADLPRLGHKHEIRNEKGCVVYPAGEPYDESNHLEMSKRLIGILSQQMSLPDDLSTSFETHFSETTKIDFGTHANEFMKQLGDDHCIVKLLKASCSQGIVSPAWVKLKLELLEGVPFKDVKLGWKVYVLFTDTFISVVHSKKEQGEPPEDSEIPPFSFTWELQMVFDREMKHLRHTSFRITDLEIGFMEPESESKLRLVARDWLEESTIPPVGKLPINPDMLPRSPISNQKSFKPAGSLSARMRTASMGGTVGRSKPMSSPRAPTISATDLALQKLLKTAWDNENNDCIPDWLKTQMDESPVISFARPNSPSSSPVPDSFGIESMFLKKALPTKSEFKAELTTPCDDKEDGEYLKDSNKEVVDHTNDSDNNRNTAADNTLPVNNDDNNNNSTSSTNGTNGSNATNNVTTTTTSTTNAISATNTNGDKDGSISPKRDQKEVKKSSNKELKKGSNNDKEVKKDSRENLNKESNKEKDKELSKESNKESPKEIIIDSHEGKDPKESPKKELTRDSSKGKEKDGNKDNDGKESPKKELTRDSSKGKEKDLGKDSNKEKNKESPKDLTRDSNKSKEKESNKESPKDLTRDSNKGKDRDLTKDSKEREQKNLRESKNLTSRLLIKEKRGTGREYGSPRRHKDRDEKEREREGDGEEEPEREREKKLDRKSRHERRSWSEDSRDKNSEFGINPISMSTDPCSSGSLLRKDIEMKNKKLRNLEKKKEKEDTAEKGNEMDVKKQENKRKLEDLVMKVTELEAELIKEKEEKALLLEENRKLKALLSQKEEMVQEPENLSASSKQKEVENVGHAPGDGEKDTKVEKKEDEVHINGNVAENIPVAEEDKKNEKEVGERGARSGSQDTLVTAAEVIDAQDTR